MSSTVSFFGTTKVRKLLLVIDCGTRESLKGPIQSIEVSYIVHATEDAQTLAKAVSTLLSVDTTPEEEQMEGHFGNAITRVRYHLTGEEAAAALGSIVARLPTPTKDKLERGIGELMDEHSALYLRFDKQRLVAGTLEEGTGDPVRIKVKPRGFLLRGGAKEFYSKILFGGN
jgi:RNA binding exosome subunit